MSLRRIWLCADDYGIAPGVNAAILALVEQRRINATSVMALAPSFDRDTSDILARRAADLNVAIGLHLTLTAPYRPLVARFSPVRDGRFLPITPTLLSALRRRFDASGLAAEIAAQFMAFREAFGRAPDFVDGHHHVHLFPQISSAVLAAIKEYAPNAWVRQCGSSLGRLRLAGDPKGLLIDTLSRDFRRRAAAAAISTNPAFAGTYRHGSAADFAGLFPRFLEGMPDGGLIMCHPGIVDAELRALDPLTDLREREFAYFGSDAFRETLARANVDLI